MKPDQAKALREPFPASAIGILPKPYKKDSPKGKCQDCGGWHGLPAVHLDYVGHAATTDRLLAVDPEWTWEPLALDEAGLPAMDAAGNLWIRLTVAGVTRIGVGDGISMKERIGDALRNAAMRFGVALDLWAKEDLHEVSGAGKPPVEQEHPRIITVETDRRIEPAEEPTLSDDQRSLMFALFNDCGITDRDAQLAGINRIIAPRQVDSRTDITRREATAVIQALKARLESLAAAE